MVVQAVTNKLHAKAAIFIFVGRRMVIPSINCSDYYFRNESAVVRTKVIIA